MRFIGRCYRGHDPHWSFTPVSSAGAARTGGRFDPRGTPTLYLSLDIVTAVAECTQGFVNRLQPLKICEYDVVCDAIADLTTEASCTALGVDPADAACAWLTAALAGKEPPSWRVTRRLAALGHTGLLVRSYVPGASATDINLVLWRWNDGGPCRVDVYDPSGRLPRDRGSWPD